MEVAGASRMDPSRIDAPFLDVAAMLALAMADDRAAAVRPGRRPADDAESLHVGVWTNLDETVRLELRADGRYGLQIAGRRSRTVGTYRADRLTVLLQADGGLRTTAQLTDDNVLHLAGNPLHRQP